MNRDNMNNIVAKEFSDALARCNEQGIDAGTVSLFEVLPDQIRSGMFDRFVDPSHPAVVNPAPPYREPVSVTQQQPIDVNRHGKPSQSQPEPAASAIKRRRL